jgi:DNA-binding CsgD family transcriptional regulator
MTRARVTEVELEGERCVVIAYPAHSPVLAALTKSEREVIERWIDGASVRAIAEARAVSTRTVANQIAGAYRKLGVSSRAQLVALARTG